MRIPNHHFNPHSICAGTAARLCALVITGSALTLSATNSFAQVIIHADLLTLTNEAYGNVTAGATQEPATNVGDSPDALWFDGAVRVLGLLHIPSGPDIGARVVAEASNDLVHLGEASILLSGAAGRLEIGKRMGLPDVLTGYAPNSFQFTSAEYGPASGQSLDPGGGLQTRLLRPALRSQLEPLAAQGVTASQFNDRSAKVLYVSPKHAGWLAGASFANDAGDARFDRLWQAGVVHESYWQQNVWRLGGTYAHARAEQSNGGAPLRDLDSFSLGTSVVLDDSLYLGIAASYDGASGLPRFTQGAFASATWGATLSVNYNTGPWTLGAYYQYANGEGDTAISGNDRLSAFDLGASYRFTTKLRVYGAVYLFDFLDEGQRSNALSGNGRVFTVGLRATI